MSDNMDIRSNLVKFYIFLYPMLPLHVGFNIGHGFPILKISRMLTVLLIIIVFLNRKTLKSAKLFLKSTYASKYILSILLSMFLTVFFSAISPLETFYFILSFCFENILFAIIVFVFFKNLSDVDDLLKYLVISSIIIGIFALFEWIYQSNPFSLLPIFNEDMTYSVTAQIRHGSIRSRASFDHAISLGAYLAMMLPIGQYRLRNKPQLLTLFFMIIISAIFTTQSRGAIISSIIYLIYFYLNFGWKKYLPVSIFCIIFATFFGLLIVLPNSNEIISLVELYLNPFSTISNVDLSTSARFNQALYIFELLKEKYLFGYGKDLVYRKSISLFSIDGLYLSHLYEFGLFGIVVNFLLYWRVFMYPRFFPKEYNVIIKYLLSSIVIFIFVNFIVSLVSYHFMFWVIVGIFSRFKYNQFYSDENFRKLQRI